MGASHDSGQRNTPGLINGGMDKHCSAVGPAPCSCGCQEPARSRCGVHVCVELVSSCRCILGHISEKEGLGSPDRPWARFGTAHGHGHSAGWVWACAKGGGPTACVRPRDTATDRRYLESTPPPDRSAPRPPLAGPRRHGGRPSSATCGRGESGPQAIDEGSLPPHPAPNADGSRKPKVAADPWEKP